MENSIIIGCDIGNKLIKTASSITPAGLQKLTGTPVVAPADPQEYLLVNGEHYLVSNKRIAYERDKSGSQAHLYLAMIALAKELRNRNLSPNSEITLAVGLPPGHMGRSGGSEPLSGVFPAEWRIVPFPSRRRKLSGQS